MKTLRKINENNPHLNHINIRKNAGKCAISYSDRGIQNIIDSFVRNSKVLLTVEYIADYFKYEVEYGKYLKEIGYLGLGNERKGSISHYEDIGKNILN